MTQQVTAQQRNAAPAHTAHNPFAAERAAHINAGTVEIESSRAIAEAQGKLVIAKKFPRDQAAAFEKVMISCSRPSLAMQAMYSYPKGGQVISGPSIRLAEELARAWGNLDFGIRELSQRPGESEMQAYCWDLETNVMSEQRFTVKHERHTKTGVTKLNDPRDIYELTANQAGRRLRARILAVLPPDLVEAAVDKCRATLAGNTTEPIADRIRKMLTAFQVFGVTKAHIEARISKPVDQLLPDELVDLITIHNSLRDNMSKPSDWFGATQQENAPETEEINDVLNQTASSQNREGMKVDTSTSRSDLTSAKANKAESGQPKKGGQAEPTAPASSSQSGQDDDEELV